MQIYIKKFQFVVSDILGWKSSRRANHDFNKLLTVLLFLFPVDTFFIQTNLKRIETNASICPNFPLKQVNKTGIVGRSPQMPRRFDLSRKQREGGYLCTKTRDPLDISPTSARDDRPETAGVKTGMNKVEKENGKPVAALSCCASSQPSLCCALIWEALGARIPSLTLSLLQFLPRLVQTNLLSAPCTDTLTPTVNGQVPEFAVH